MLVSKAIEFIDTFIGDTVSAYKVTDKSKDASGTYIPHPLEAKTDTDKLTALDFGIKYSALNSKPLTLLESNSSTATEFKRISPNEFIRVPSEPTLTGSLDIDESLSYAVIYKALSFLWSGYATYSSDADAIIVAHNDATRDYFINREATTNFTETIFFRYSSDGTNWHDTFIDGDKYISFKQGDGVWSSAIKFVGDDGTAGSGGGASSFVDLSDTPSTLTASKLVAVNSAGDALELIDPPTTSTGGGNPDFDNMTGTEGASGAVVLDLLYANGNRAFHYIDFTADGTLDISKADGANYDMEIGRTYTLQIFPNGNNVTIAFTAYGDVTLDANSTNMLQIVYDGWDIYVLSNNKFV